MFGVDRYDYIIVGAGSAGCVMAGRLSEDADTRVLLLEAGPSDRKMEVRIPAAFPKLFKTERDWDYSTQPQERLDGRELYWPRGRMLGGCSSINAQMYVRGNPADYDEWAALGNDGWGWDAVLPYFRRSEHNGRGGDAFHGGDGPLYVEQLRDPSPLTIAAVEAAVQAGIPRIDDVNGPTQEGVALSEVTQHRGRRWSAADAFLRPARKRPNLTVITGGHATRVLLDGTRAVGVEYRHDDRLRQATVAREVILSGGSINSPQLLMLSGIGPRDELDSVGIARGGRPAGRRAQPARSPGPAVHLHRWATTPPCSMPRSRLSWSSTSPGARACSPRTWARPWPSCAPVTDSTRPISS